MTCCRFNASFNRFTTFWQKIPWVNCLSGLMWNLSEKWPFLEDLRWLAADWKGYGSLLGLEVATSIDLTLLADKARQSSCSEATLYSIHCTKVGCTYFTLFYSWMCTLPIVQQLGLHTLHCLTVGCTHSSLYDNQLCTLYSENCEKLKKTVQMVENIGKTFLKKSEIFWKKAFKNCEKKKWKAV